MFQGDEIGQGEIHPRRRWFWWGIFLARAIDWSHPRVLGALDDGRRGAEGTESYRQFFEEGGKRISPWHDIPLEAGGGAYNMVTEIPKYGLAKMEVDTKGESNPIMQDTKKGKLRFYHGPIFWNYGCLPVHKSTTPPRRRAGVASMAWRSTERAVTF